MIKIPPSTQPNTYAVTLALAATLVIGAATAAKAQPADPNYQAQAQDYQQKQQQYQAQKQDYEDKQIAHAQAQDAYDDKRALYHAQRSAYAAQKRDYEHARADYDAKYGPGAFDTYTKTVTTRTYGPAGDGTVTTVRKEVIEH